jgi:outer membrane protein TolC
MRLEASILLVAVALGGCISTSVREDVQSVRELAQAIAIADVAGPVDDAAPSDVREILAQPLDADAAVRIALVNNRELRARLRELGVARARVLQAGFLPNPLVEGEISPERQTGVALRVEWNVAGLLLAPLRADAAGADLDVARFETAGAVIEAGYQVRAAFYGLLAAEETLAVAQRQLDALAAARDASRALAEAGNLRALDVAAREAAFEEERVHVAEVELDVIVARERVQRLLGLHGEETTWTTAGPLPAVPETTPDAAELERRAIEASLELRAMQSRMVAAARRAGLARAEGVLPELLVDLHALVGNGLTDPTMPSQSVALGGGLALRLPIFDRGDGRVAAFEHILDAQFERYVGAAIDVRSAARETDARVQSSAARARHFATTVLPARQRVLDEALLQYDAMQVSVFTLLEALAARQTTEREEIGTRREYWTALAARDALLAGHHVGSASPTETTTPPEEE